MWLTFIPLFIQGNREREREGQFTIQLLDPQRSFSGSDYAHFPPRSASYTPSYTTKTYESGTHQRLFLIKNILVLRCWQHPDAQRSNKKNQTPPKDSAPPSHRFGFSSLLASQCSSSAEVLGPAAPLVAQLGRRRPCGRLERLRAPQPVALGHGTLQCHAGTRA